MKAANGVCVQDEDSQRELLEEDPCWPDQRVLLRLQQRWHGGPHRPSAPQTQLQGEWNQKPNPFRLAWSILTWLVFSLQSLSGSLHNVGEDFCSVPSPCPPLSGTPCSSSQPDLCSSSSEQSSSSYSQASLPVYNKQVDDLCIIRVSVECVSNGNMYKSILVRMAA